MSMFALRSARQAATKPPPLPSLIFHVAMEYVGGEEVVAVVVRSVEPSRAGVRISARFFCRGIWDLVRLLPRDDSAVRSHCCITRKR